MKITVHDADGVRTIDIGGPDLEAACKAVAESDIWCRCGDAFTFGSYPEDGACGCGIHKHHVHCGTCGKVSQIG